MALYRLEKGHLFKVEELKQGRVWTCSISSEYLPKAAQIFCNAYDHKDHESAVSINLGVTNKF